MNDKPNIYIVDDDLQYMEMLKDALISKIKNAKITLFSNSNNFLRNKNLPDVDLFIVDIKLKSKNNNVTDGRNLCLKLPILCVMTPLLFISGYNITKEMFQDKYNFHIYDFADKIGGTDILINRAKILLNNSCTRKIFESSTRSEEINNLSDQGIRSYWENMIKKDRSYISSFVSKVNNNFLLGL